MFLLLLCVLHLRRSDLHKSSVNVKKERLKKSHLAMIPKLKSFEVFCEVCVDVATQARVKIFAINQEPRLLRLALPKGCLENYISRELQFVTNEQVFESQDFVPFQRSFV